MKMLPVEAPSAEAVLAKAADENFPVTSRLFPRSLRPHLVNVYGFARLADDIGDEAPGDRAVLLDWLWRELDAAFDDRPEHPLLRRLAFTVRGFDLPREPFRKLIQANRQDQSVSRYRTFDELLAYCELSANPVGELVLRIAGAITPERLALSNATCTALQLVEFWQDLGEDGARGRVYLPDEDLNRFGYPETDLLSGVRDQRFVSLMRFEASRTRRLFEQGRGLASSLGGRLGVAVRLFTAGGLAALEDLERRGFDAFNGSAHASRLRRLWAAAREVVRWA